MFWRSALLVALLAAACMTYGQQVEQVRQSLIGLEGRSLRRCMPVPTISDIDDDLELVVYRWTPKDEEKADFEVLDTGELKTERTRSREWSEFLLGGEEPRDQAFCELTFELQGGLIKDVRSNGRDASGLNSDAKCLMEARDCLPEEVPTSVERDLELAP